MSFPNMDGDLMNLGGSFSGNPNARVVREVRRQSDPLRAQHLWDAIKAVRCQKQIPAIPRMARYMTRFYGLNKESTQRLLDLAVEDNLIKLENKIGTKGNKNGVEEKAYRLPTPDMLPRERHDWYCFHCHLGGEVVLCSGCHRVYHEACLKEPILDETDFFCVICKTLQKIPDSQNKKDRKDLNHLLRQLVQKLQERMPGPLLARELPQASKVDEKPASTPGKSSTDQPAPALPTIVAVTPTGETFIANIAQTPTQGASYTSPVPVTPTNTMGQPMTPTFSNGDLSKKMEDDDSWRAKFLLKSQIDFETIEEKCNTMQYRIVEEFRADAQLLVHNIVIFHGAHSSMADLARQMLRDCTHDLKDIQLCRDCFRYSCDTDDKHWFCKPCRPVHELVYAKQKGFPYWPAKVMRVSSEGMHDVRFFGGYHQRALVDKTFVKPITVNVQTLQVKRTSLWKKACEELRRHQEVLSRIKAHPDFCKDPYGNPFDSEEVSTQYNVAILAVTTGEDDIEEAVYEEQESEEEFNPELNNKTEHPSVRTSKTQSSSKALGSTPNSAAATATPVVGKKRPGRPKKIKREDPPENIVSSSSQESTSQVHIGIQTSSKLLRSLVEGTAGYAVSRKAMEKEFKHFAEKMRADFDQEKKRAVNVATRSLERDLERLKADHATEIEEMVERHRVEVSEMKKKQWCNNCEKEAIYWCCWNTAYCTIGCQQDHWNKDHKKVCKRKR